MKKRQSVLYQGCQTPVGCIRVISDHARLINWINQIG